MQHLEALKSVISEKEGNIMTKMKKIISMFLVTAIIFTMSVCVFAENTTEMQTVLETVKTRIGSTDEYENFESSMRTSGNNTVYSFYWNTGGEVNKYLSVSATVSGIITDYFYDDGSHHISDKPSLKRMELSEAKEKAVELISKLNPQISDKCVLTERNSVSNLYSDEISFSIQRYENGIPVKGNDGFVRISGDGRYITNYYINYDENIVFPAVDKAITKEEAQKIYGEKTGLKLMYTAEYDYSTKTRTLKLVYVPKSYDKFVNALTGELCEYVNNEEYRFDAVEENAAADKVMMSTNSAMGSSSLSEAEKAEVSEIAGLKTKEELTKIVKKNKYINIADGMELTNYRTSKSVYDEEYTATMTFQINTKDDYRYTSVTVDMKTGEIKSFDKDYIVDTKGKKQLSEDKLSKIKEKAIKELAGGKFSEYKPEEDYIRYINGIPYGNDYIRVIADKITGEITSYRMSYTKAEFPKPDGIISESEAVSNLFLQVDYELWYSKMESGKDEASLIYILDENKTQELDAFSGNLISYNSDLEEKFTGYTDISGHYAEEMINTLASFGIRFETNEFKPDEPILQKDYINLLVSVFINRGSVILKESSLYEDEYRIANNTGIILPEEKNEFEVVTRELAAKYMIRAMGAEEYANIPDIYVTLFSDVIRLKGQIAILSGMGIVKGSGNGLFNPEKTLTRADAIIMIYNYLSR